MRVLQILVLIVLFCSFNFNVEAQADCSWGIKLYIRDKTGNIIENPKLEMIGSDVPHYSSLKDYHFWGEPMGTGVQGDFRLKVVAEGFEKFETKINFPNCDKQVFELKLKPIGSPETADFVRLTNLSGFIKDWNDERVKGIKVVLTNKNGEKFESVAENGLYDFEIYSGEYLIEFLGFQESESVKIDKMHFEKESTRLNVNLKTDKQLGERKTELVCKNYSNEDKSTWCNLMITLPK